MNWNKDFILRIVSLLLSVFMWFYVIDVQNPETEITITDIPIKYINTESVGKFGLVLVNNSNKKLSLKVSGRRKAVSTLNNENIIAYADFNGLNNVGEFPIMVQVELPREDIKVIDKEPYNIDVELDKVKEIQKQITVVAQGSIDEPYIGLEPKITPNLVTIEGPSNIVNNVNTVKAFLDIEKGTDDIITNQKIVLFDNDNNIINNDSLQLSVETVEIQYPIKMKKTVPIEANLIGTPPGSYVVEDVTVNPTNITIIGEENDINNVTSIMTNPIEVSSFYEDQEVSTGLMVTEGIQLYGSVNNATVNIQINKEIVKTISVDNIKTYNIPEKLSYNLLTKALNVTVKGMETQLEDMSSNDILAYINLSGYEEGEHAVPVEINVKDGLTVLGEYNALIKLETQNNNTQEDENRQQNNDNTTNE